MSPWKTAGMLTEDGGFNDYPADLYLQAKDLLDTHVTPSAVEQVKRQRFALFRNAEMKIRNMQLAVSSARAFDRTGHAGEALGHVEASFKEVKRVVTLLVEDIEASEAAYLENLRERLGEHGTKPAGAAVEPSPQAPAVPANDSSHASPISGEETAGAAVTPNAVAPVLLPATQLPAGTDLDGPARDRIWALPEPEVGGLLAPKPGPGIRMAARR